MKGAKMSRKFFFKTIEAHLSKLEREVQEIKENEELSSEARIAKTNIVFGRVLELYNINASAMNIDYREYTKLDERIRALIDKI